METVERILVTGAAGHLGSHLIPALTQDGFDVCGLDRVAPPAPAPGVRFIQADLANPEAVTEALSGRQLVVHCASIHPWKPYADSQYLDANVKGAWLLYAACAAQGIDRVVLTSSIAAIGYPSRTQCRRLREDDEFPLTDLYSFTKHAQEDTARLFAGKGSVRTIALRPPAFMPKPDLQTGFGLTGAFGLVDDMVSAHRAAVRVLSGRQATGREALPFEAIFTTNRLPYQDGDDTLLGPDGNMVALVRKYWPEACDWLVAKGYRQAWLPGVYDLTKAKELLGWAPAHNFGEWFREHGTR